MNIFKKWFGTSQTVSPKTHTVMLTFRDDNGRVWKITHNHVEESNVWFRVLAHTPDCEPVTAIHQFRFADGTHIMYRDDPAQRLMEFKTE